MIDTIRNKFVSLVYADHNQSKAVTREIEQLLKKYDENTHVLNIGSGNKRIRPHVKNLDIKEGENIDYIVTAESIPINTESIDLIITQEAFEHIRDPKSALDECYRVLKRGGVIYFQVPFIIGYHPGPTDFIRFTKEGVTNFLEQSGFIVNKTEITVAGATGFYRVSVEFFAILFSGPVNQLYMPLKGIFAVLLYPIKFLDPWFRISKQKNRIPGGYYAIATKPLEDS